VNGAFSIASVDTAGWLGWAFAAPAEAAPPAAGEDAAWLERAGRGDESALQRLFDRWKLPLLSFFYRSLGSRPDAEDLTLEVFVRLHRAAGRYRPSAKFSTFLFHIARNLLRNEFRRRHRKPAAPMAAETFAYLAADPDGSARRAVELEEVFQHALARLPEKYRTPLLLLQQQHLEYAEAAAVLHVTENALRVLVFRGRQLLKTEMESLQ
jgi:RNA polymerase sigma-70 factor, ECF subfamily